MTNPEQEMLTGTGPLIIVDGIKKWNPYLYLIKLVSMAIHTGISTPAVH
jgi:hypothetical protein